MNKNSGSGPLPSKPLTGGNTEKLINGDKAMSPEELKDMPFALKLESGIIMVSRSKAVEIMANLAAQLAMREENGGSG